MATDYRRSKAAEWTAEDVKKFEEIRNSLKWESYPNGNAGWESRHEDVFVKAGFRWIRHSQGDPRNIGISWFEPQ